MEALEVPRVRLDKWLWAARFYKTRSQAAEAIEGGKVLVNGDRVKPARPVRAGDEVRIRLGPYQYLLEVRAVSERRGPAAAAATLYEESVASKAARETLALQLKALHAAFPEPDQRPSKRDRRRLSRFKRKK